MIVGPTNFDKFGAFISLCISWACGEDDKSLHVKNKTPAKIATADKRPKSAILRNSDAAENTPQLSALEFRIVDQNSHFAQVKFGHAQVNFGQT